MSEQTVLYRCILIYHVPIHESACVLRLAHANRSRTAELQSVQKISYQERILDDAGIRLLKDLP